VEKTSGAGGEGRRSHMEQDEDQCHGLGVERQKLTWTGMCGCSICNWDQYLQYLQQHYKI